VDAGGQGLVAVLGALVQALTGQEPQHPWHRAEGHARVPGDDDEDAPHVRVDGDRALVEDCPADAEDGSGPAFEVIYLLEAEDAAVARLRTRLDSLGDSLVVVGGDGLWNVHVHVDDAGAAVEAGVEAGRPYRIRITHFGSADAHSAGFAAPPR
ncbi:dihydroxyacetone kinase, partial [Streptomyces sp. T-3]|nr:dihydroxyacetone kinase [Streptomyces sp. T-3]